MTQTNFLSRRAFGALLGAGLISPHLARAQSAREIGWEDLIPPGVPYSEIIAMGEVDEENDTWNPIFDENGTRLNPALHEQMIRMPGFIIPLLSDADGVREFILVPYAGACIHVPPPPPNQMVFVTTQTPWPNDKLFDAIWVTGRMSANLQSTELGNTGYEIAATQIELYEWL